MVYTALGLLTVLYRTRISKALFTYYPLKKDTNFLAALSKFDFDEEFSVNLNSN